MGKVPVTRDSLSARSAPPSRGLLPSTSLKLYLQTLHLLSISLPRYTLCLPPNSLAADESHCQSTLVSFPPLVRVLGVRASVPEPVSVI